MQRIELAQLVAIGFHEPKRLADEHRAALADAGPAIDLLEFNRRLTAELEAGGVMED